MTKFVKMHGLGNDFIVFKGPMNIEKSKIAKLCDRNFGIGSDGLLIISPSEVGAKMEYWNADGSVAEMCGNGLRCVARFAVENDIAKPGDFKVETAAGILEVSWDGQDANQISVQVGKVIVEPEPVDIQGHTFYIANAGNPHAIIFVDDVSSASVTTIGPKIETDAHFPNKTNVEFAQVENENKVNLRIWERGVGETKACGTGMVATAIATNKLGKTHFPTKIQVPGGVAEVWVDEAGFACLKAPAVNVFSGEVEI